MNRTALWTGAAACAIAALAWLALGQRDQSSADQQPRTANAERTIGDVWRMPAADSSVPHTRIERSALDEASLRHALRDVRVDARGKLVLDHSVLEALRRSFASTDVVDDTQLAALRGIIRDAVRGPTGEQAAKLVSDYYIYQAAARAMSADAMGGDLESVEAQFNRLLALREAHFGPQAAQGLFGDEQAYTRYTIESMKIEMDASLSDEAKDRKQAALLATLPPRLQPQQPSLDSQRASTPDDAWRARMVAFQREKEAILGAGLSEDDEDTQLHQLLHEHFTEEELARVLRYDPTIDHARH